MPATLPPPTPTPIPEPSTDYFSEPSGVPPHADTASLHGTSQVKRCYYCRSPLSSDNNMTFHVEIFEGDGIGGGIARQEQICARCVIRGGILGSFGEDADEAVHEFDEATDGQMPVEAEERVRCTVRPEDVEQAAVVASTDEDSNVHMDDRPIHQEQPLFTPPHSPHPDDDNINPDERYRLLFNRGLQESFTQTSGPSSPVDKNGFQPARPSTSPPSNLAVFQAAPSFARHTPPRTPSPADASSILFGPHVVQTIMEEQGPSSEVAQQRHVTLPDLYCDITHLKRRTDGRGCLYPGSVFSGTQRSGRNSYDVKVTIVDVSFAEATLTGYLLIHNLTPSHPELTTLFTADIIGGPYHGFHTGEWGATEEDDFTHWSRFRSFSGLKKEMQGPKGTIDSRERNCVYMRWKERFLVPDHRVRDINGASFAGFYYVCVDLDPACSADNGSGLTFASASQHPLTQSHLPSATRANASVTPSGGRSRAATLMGDIKSFDWTTHEREKVEAMERARGKGYGTAMMEGLYYHQNSEPYQHLSLRHMPERTSATFEFR